MNKRKNTKEVLGEPVKERWIVTSELRPAQKDESWLLVEGGRVVRLVLSLRGTADAVPVLTSIIPAGWPE
jgi:hypothetical protein